MALLKIQQPPPRLGPVLQDHLGTPHVGYMFSLQWDGWFKKLANSINSNIAAGYTGTISLAKLTSTGTNGSITVVNGVITAVTEPT